MKILVAVDGSECADDIIDFVLSHNWTLPCEFTVIHVIPPNRMSNVSVIFPGDVLDAMEEQAWTEGRIVARRSALRLRDATKSEHIYEEIVRGNPKEEILTFAQAWQPDVIVIGSRGCGAIKRAVLGSVSLAILTSADCTVMVVRPPNKEKHAKAGATVQSLSVQNALF